MYFCYKNWYYLKFLFLFPTQSSYPLNIHELINSTDLSSYMWRISYNIFSDLEMINMNEYCPQIFNKDDDMTHTHTPSAWKRY